MSPPGHWFEGGLRCREGVMNVQDSAYVKGKLGREMFYVVSYEIGRRAVIEHPVIDKVFGNLPC